MLNSVVVHVHRADRRLSTLSTHMRLNGHTQTEHALTHTSSQSHGLENAHSHSLPHARALFFSLHVPNNSALFSNLVFTAANTTAAITTAATASTAHHLPIPIAMPLSGEPAGCDDDCSECCPCDGTWPDAACRDSPYIPYLLFALKWILIVGVPGGVACCVGVVVCVKKRGKQRAGDSPSIHADAQPLQEPLG